VDAQLLLLQQLMLNLPQLQQLHPRQPLQQLHLPLLPPHQLPMHLPLLPPHQLPMHQQLPRQYQWQLHQQLWPQ
jgi:hypothetical protein